MSDAAIASDSIDVMFRAIERGDMATFQTCFAPAAVVWHNHDEIALEIDKIADDLAALFAATTAGLQYVDQKIARTGTKAFSKHALNAHLRNGREFHLAAMMWIDLDDNGLITRIDEYFDSRALDVLAV